MDWIKVSDRLPEKRDKPYQVVGACNKQLRGVYEELGVCTRGFYQDWVVRRWPQNFVAWMYGPEHVQMPVLKTFGDDAALKSTV